MLNENVKMSFKSDYLEKKKSFRLLKNEIDKLLVIFILNTYKMNKLVLCLRYDSHSIKNCYR